MRKTALFIAALIFVAISHAQDCGSVIWKKNGKTTSVTTSNGVGVVTKDYFDSDCAGKAAPASAPIVEEKKDTDNDGIIDSEDNCPTVAGTKENNGCPKKEEAPVDTDNDGVVDASDNCPNTPSGVAVDAKGCAKDSDGDGVADYKDKCPGTSGIASLGGCPDSDGDGVTDKKDKCPSVKGIASLGGCPDSDGDGIIDSKDKCPNEFGIASQNGCPAPTEEEEKVFNDALEGVKFYSGKDVMTSNSKVLIEKVYGVLDAHPEMQLKISGYTDSAGKEESNLILSQKRAKAVYDYLVEKGIDPNRLSHEGHGEENPIADNATSAGRAKNRRVEFTPFY